LSDHPHHPGAPAISELLPLPRADAGAAGPRVAPARRRDPAGDPAALPRPRAARRGRGALAHASAADAGLLLDRPAGGALRRRPAVPALGVLRRGRAGGAAAPPPRAASLQAPSSSTRHLPI